MEEEIQDLAQPLPTDEDQNPPQNVTPADTVASKVIAHFSARWATFLKGFKSDLTAIGNTLDHPKVGLVVKVQNLEETVHKIQNGKPGSKGLDETLQGFDTRISAVETACSKAPTPPTTTTADAENLTHLTNRVTTLESQCSKDDTGLPLKIKQLEAKQAAMEEVIQAIAYKNPQGEINLKHKDIVNLQRTSKKLAQDQQTTAGFLHITRKNVCSISEKVNMNLAKIMRNTLIFGGVRSTEEETAMTAVKRFLTNLMELNPRSADLLEAEFLSKGYTRRVKGKDINFPPGPCVVFRQVCQHSDGQSQYSGGQVR